MSVYKENLIEDITALVSKCLSIPLNQLELDSDLEDFGMDSISIHEISMEIEKLYPISIEPGLFFDLRTIQALSDYLETAYPTELAQHYQVSV